MNYFSVQCTDATQEGKDNRGRAEAGSSMSDCMNNTSSNTSQIATKGNNRLII